MTRARRVLTCCLSATIIALAAPRLPAGQRTIGVGPRETITFGPLINAPNGHISFQKERGGYRLWLPGRLKDDSIGLNEEGGFLFDVPGWSTDDLAKAQPTYVLGPRASDCDPADTSFDRNYAAMNAVVPAADGRTLLAFYDAEYHVDCPNGQPLFSSIGLATSDDGGVTWQKQGQVIQGLDEARDGFAFVVSKQLEALHHGNDKFDVGASGPSAVVREDNGVAYIYVYYADRTPITGGDDSIYVARALLASGGTPGNWQQWTGGAWGAVGDQTSAVPIVVPQPGGVALQPHVSWNTALRRWLMVFKAKSDFEITTSADGVQWDPPSSLLAFDPNDFNNGFPTLVSPDSGGCSELNCRDDSGLRPGANASQQVTGPVGWLFYSSLPDKATQYVGHRAPFRISGE